MKISFEEAVAKWKQGNFTMADVEFYFGHSDAFLYEVMHELSSLYSTIIKLENEVEELESYNNALD